MTTSYKTYPQRWFLLTSLVLLNISSAINWITFSAISNIAADYFHVSLTLVNFLSVIFYLAYVVVSLFSSWVLDTKGLRTGVISLYSLVVLMNWCESN